VALGVLMRQAKHKQVETSMPLKLFAIRLPDGSLLTDTMTFEYFVSYNQYKNAINQITRIG
jgi:hypothetical protein